MTYPLILTLSRLITTRPVSRWPRYPHLGGRRVTLWKVESRRRRLSPLYGPDSFLPLTSQRPFVQAPNTVLFDVNNEPSRTIDSFHPLNDHEDQSRDILTCHNGFCVWKIVSPTLLCFFESFRHSRRDIVGE